MNDARNPTALVRHAVEVGDWRLVELLARRLSDRFTGQTTVAHRAYGTLVEKLGLGDPDNYHRR